MAKDIKALRKRIKSFDSTLHLTGAMGLVASSKMRKATDAMLQGRKYLKAVSEIVDDLTRSQECRKSVFFSEEPEQKITDSTRLWFSRKTVTTPTRVMPRSPAMQ